MKKTEKLYCGDNGEVCPEGKTCANGICVEKINPIPPETTPTED
jgi:hypothetical protein